jgi:hypothetical protein
VLDSDLGADVSSASIGEVPERPHRRLRFPPAPVIPAQDHPPREQELGYGE